MKKWGRLFRIRLWWTLDREHFCFANSMIFHNDRMCHVIVRLNLLKFGSLLFAIGLHTRESSNNNQSSWVKTPLFHWFPSKRLSGEYTWKDEQTMGHHRGTCGTWDGFPQAPQIHINDTAHIHSENLARSLGVSSRNACTKLEKGCGYGLQAEKCAGWSLEIEANLPESLPVWPEMKVSRVISWCRLLCCNFFSGQSLGQACLNRDTGQTHGVLDYNESAGTKISMWQLIRIIELLPKKSVLLVVDKQEVLMEHSKYIRT